MAPTYDDYPFRGLRERIDEQELGAPVAPLGLPGRRYERNDWRDHVETLDDPFRGRPQREDSRWELAAGQPAPPPVGSLHPPPGPIPTAARPRSDVRVGTAY